MTKQEIIGLILGSVCFLPIFLIAIMLTTINKPIAITTLIITECMWITSIALCTQGLEIKNRQLRKRIKELEGNACQENKQ